MGGSRHPLTSEQPVSLADREDDALVTLALLKWPNVPACYRWLGLNGRGNWLIQGAPITHPGIRHFLSRHYQVDHRGCWFVQNGPQRAYVDLELAPWVFLLDGEQRLITHTGRLVDHPEALFVTDSAQLFIRTECGFGALSDRDLAQFLSQCQCTEDPSKGRVIESMLELSAGSAVPFTLEWRTHRMRCQYVPERILETEFGFQRQPPANLPT